MTISRIGAWTDRRGVVGKGWPKWLQVAKTVGLTDVSFNLNAGQIGARFAPFVSPGQAAAISKAYADEGIRPHAMFWPQPSLVHADAVLDYLEAMLSAGAPLAASDLDAEGPWCKSPLLRKHARAVAAYYRERWPKALPLAVNGITRAIEELDALLDVADVGIPQAYTSTVPGQTSTPGERQTEVIRIWRAQYPKLQLVCGLAAYSQEGAGGLPALKAMERAFAAAEASGVAEVRYWQLANLSDGVARAFVRARCQELAGGGQ